MAKLTRAQQQRATELAEKIFKWEAIAESHSAVLRTDLKQMEEARAQFAVGAPPVGFLPPRDQFAAYVAEAELTLQSNAITFVDRTKAVSCCLFLCRVTMMLSAEEDYAVHLEMKRKRSALHNQQYLSTLTSVPYSNQQVNANGASQTTILPEQNFAQPPPESFDYPIALPPFISLTFKEISGTTRVKVDEAAIEGYRKNPDRLFECIFTSEAEGDEGEEAYRVSAILTDIKERLFYVVFAGEGAEGVCHTSEAFFEMLSGSSRVGVV